MRTLSIAAFLLAAFAALAPAAASEAGLRPISIPDPAGIRPLRGYLWYPTDVADPPHEALGNAVFRGVRVIEEAPPAAGRFPLLVLSHGMYGNARNQAWLAAALARRGFVVAAIDHPGTSSFARDPDAARTLWERPRDITRVIDHLLAAPDPAIDPQRIVMAGHSLGGFTALLLAGARYDAARVDGLCAADPQDLICRIMRGWHVAETPADRSAMEGDLSDPRIRAFAVFDLGATQSFSPESLAGIDRPLLVIGAPRDVEGTGLDLDVESRALVARLAHAPVTYLEPATLSHFDFLGECTETGLARLRKDEPDDAFVCLEGTDARRAEHEEIIEVVATFFAAD